MLKKGVSLIILVITIIVLIIITSTVIVSISDITTTTMVAKFGEELKTLEDKIREYYVLNGTLPVYNDAKYTAEELTNLNTLGHGRELQNEINKNKDTLSTFYEIDYLLIDTVITERGVEKTIDDIYVVSSESNKVYYVQGLVFEDIVYFSTVNISGTTKVN